MCRVIRFKVVLILPQNNTYLHLKTKKQNKNKNPLATVVIMTGGEEENPLLGRQRLWRQEVGGCMGYVS